MVRAAGVVWPLCGRRWIDAHPADWVSYQLHARLWSARMGPQHVDSARCDEAPGHNGYQEQEGDIEKGRVVPRRLGFEDGDVVIGGRQPKELEGGSDQESGQGHRGVGNSKKVERRPAAVVLPIDVQ